VRILFYNHAAEISGAERSLLAMMGWARHAGHTVACCTPRGPLAQETANAHVSYMRTRPLVIGHTHNPLVLTRYLAHMAAPVRDLVSATRHFHPDVVHANSIRAGVVAAIAVRAIAVRAPASWYTCATRYSRARSII